MVCLFVQTVVDPSSLLKALDPLLGPQGEIKGTEQVTRIVK